MKKALLKFLIIIFVSVLSGYLVYFVVQKKQPGRMDSGASKSQAVFNGAGT